MISFYLLVAGMPFVKQRFFARFISDLTVVKYLGAACLVYALWHWGTGGGSGRALRSGMLGLFAAFYTWAAISHFTLSLPVPWPMSPFFSFTSFLLLFFIVGVVVDTPQRLRGTLLSAMAAVGLGSAYMVREWLQYHNVYKDFRPGWAVGDANYFTLSALLCVPFLFFLLPVSRSRLERAFIVGVLLLTIAGVALGASRGGLLGLTAEFAYIVWRSRRRALHLALIACLALPALAWAPISPIHRLLHPDYSDVAAENNRLVVWRAGWRMIAAHPLAGIGLGNFKPMVTGYEDATGPRVESLAHNTYIETAAELGLPGLLLFVALLVTGFRQAGRVRRRLRASGGMLHQAALGLQAAVLGAAVAITFLSADQQKLLWLMLALVPCLAALAEAAPIAVPMVATQPAAEAVRTEEGTDMVAWARTVAEIFR